MKQIITIKDVARESGVSPSTVSFVLNGTKGQSISQETSSRVFETAKRLGYTPNFMAKNIKKRQSMSIGVIAAYDIKYMYFLDMIDGIVNAAEHRGYSTTICGSGKETCSASTFLGYYKENRIDGAILISSAHSEELSNEKNFIEIFKANSIPYVVIYGYAMDRDSSYVNIDFFQDGYDATTHLVEQGCKEIAYIAPMDKANMAKYLPRTERDRISGYIEALTVTGTKNSEENILYLPRDFRNSDYKSILELFDGRRDIDGVVTCWATYGLQILKLALDLEIKVPEQLKIIALDTIPYLKYASTGLSSMRLPFYEIASKGTEVLLEKLSGTNRNTVKINLPCELMKRESSW